VIAAALVHVAETSFVPASVLEGQAN
jgi:hypothetical protein